MKHLTIVVFLIFSFSAFAQLDINEAYNRNNELKSYLDTQVHANIRPNYLKDTANCKNHLTMRPVFYENFSYDLKSKNPANLLYIGGQLIASYKNFNLNIIPFYGYYKAQNYNSYLSDSLGVIPGFGKKNLFLFGNTIGHFSYAPADFITFELGNDKNFFGDGYRSLLLSDNASPYPFFKTDVHIWKINYIWMISRMQGFDTRYSDSVTDFYPKITYTHYLSFNLLKRLNFSMFETVVTSPYDSLDAHRGLDFNYLNPVIFYRPIEIQIGSPDNVLVGFSGHLRLFKSTIFYGQIFIDEMIFSHIKSPDEYWDEKYGLQAGYKCYNTFGIKNFFTQVEFNAVRPYTYSHLNPVRSYTHLNQPLAHPLGANFAEAVAIASYQYKDFFAEIKLTYAKFGDNDTTNYGRDPLLSYASRPSDENILWFQGVNSSLETLSTSFGFEKYGYMIRARFIYRTFTGNENGENLILCIDFGIPLYKVYDF